MFRVTTGIALGLVASWAVAQDAFVSLDEMEQNVGARWQDVTGAGLDTLLPDEEIVKEGAQSGRWDPSTGAQQIYLAPEGMPTDWAAHGALELWVHSAQATGAVFAISIHSENERTPGEDYFRCLVPVDWDGWRFLHLEPRSFARGREPVGWQQVDSLRLSIGGWSDLKYVPGTVLNFDAVRLLTMRPDPERKVLFEPDTDWCAWWPLGYTTDPVETGRYAAEWYAADRAEGVVNRSVPANWSGSTYLNLWLHAQELETATLTLNVGSDSPATPEPDGYAATVDTAWAGWQLVALPLQSFERVGAPTGWHAVDSLTLSLSQPGEFSDEARLCLDDIWLSALAGATELPPDPNGTDGTPPGIGAPTVTAPGGGDEPTPDVDLEKTMAEALAAKKDGDLEVAFTKYISVLLRKPGHIGAHWGLAWVLAQREENEAAIEHFEAVAELSKDPEQVAEANAAIRRLKAGE